MGRQKLAFLKEYSENIKTIDQKGRFAISRKIKKLLDGDVLAVIKGFNGCLFAYDSDKWKDIKEKLEKPSFDPQHIKRSRIVGATMEEVTIDNQGRILLSKGLMEYAGLKPGGKVYLNYAFDRIEIWQLEKFQYEMKDELSEESYQKMLQSIFE